MSVERIFHCDGPECDHHVRSRLEQPPVFLTMTSREPDRVELHFCGWDCVLRHAATKEPETVISGSDVD